jgi:hypothetical protein
MHDIPDLDRRGLQKFGLTTGGILVVLFGLVLPWLRDRPLPLWPWCVAAVLAVWALAAPASLTVVYRPWMKAGLLLGWLNTRIILGLVFWIIIMPLGVILRLLKEKKVGRIIGGLDRSATTYWHVPTNIQHTSMEKPF